MVMTYKVGISQRKICGGVELKYYCIFVRGVLMIPMILGAMVFLLSPVYALGQGKGDVEGSSGTLFVHGALTESACRLEMASAHQDVLLGEIGTGRLQKIGSRGEPVWIELHLEDCLRSPRRLLRSFNDPLRYAIFQRLLDHFRIVGIEEHVQLTLIQIFLVLGAGGVFNRVRVV